MDSWIKFALDHTPGEFLYTAGSDDYFCFRLNGYNVTFRKNKTLPHSLRVFLLNDELAWAMGFYDCKYMREVLHTTNKLCLTRKALERHFKLLKTRKMPKNKRKRRGLTAI